MSIRKRNRELLVDLKAALGDDYLLYDDSLAYRENAFFVLARKGLDKTLVVLAGGRRAHRVTRLFDLSPVGEIALGRRHLNVLTARLDHGNAVALRTAFGHLRPRPLGLAPAFGMGDRLGLATPAHAASIRTRRLLPLFAQQSAREMSRTGRTPQEVLDDATWGAFQVGHVGCFGADADHLKTQDDVARCVDAGFTMFTIDPGELVCSDGDALPDDSLRQRFDAFDDASLLRDLYVRSFDFPQADFRLDLDERSLAGSAVKYLPAVERVALLFHQLADLYRRGPFDFEVSIDETDVPTTPADHVFVASELKRRGVTFTGLAPRFVGDFEKAVDYRGDIGRFRSELLMHAAIARAIGPYKLSVHSGSDKFSIYPLLADVAGDILHVKTAGTSWLEAVRLVALRNPSLFRRVYDLALQRFATDRASYHLTTNIDVLPDLDTLRDGELEPLLDERNVRQLIHVTYGSVLTATDPSGNPTLRDEFLQTLQRHEDDHYRLVGAHMDKHLDLLDTQAALP